MEIKRNKSTAPTGSAQAKEQETTTMMTIRLSTISEAEATEKEKTDIKIPSQLSKSLMATLAVEALCAAAETCVCVVVLDPTTQTINLDLISEVDLEIEACVAVA